MTNKNEFKEPGENSTENIGIIGDPLTSANPTDKEYSKYNATIKTDFPGQIPDIPEPDTDHITVDFTKGSDEQSSDSPRDHSLNDGDDNDNAGSEKPDGPTGSGSTVDFSQNEKFLMAQVLTGISMEGLGVLNDFIINKWMVTEEHVRNRILEGKADPELLEFSIDLGGGLLINVKEFITKNKVAVEESFTFTKDEKKRFTELLALILKDNNAQLKPEWMLVAMLFQKYGIGMYNMYKLNQETTDLLDRVNYLIEINRKNHNIPSSPGVTIEGSPKTPEPDNTRKKHTGPPKGKNVKRKSALTKKQEVEEGSEGADKVSQPIGDIREAGEHAPTRRHKRTVSKEEMNKLVEDISFTEIKS